jgi:hypothetical protein
MLARYIEGRFDTLDSIKRAKFFCHSGISILIRQLHFLQKILARLIESSMRQRLLVPVLSARASGSI